MVVINRLYKYPEMQQPDPMQQKMQEYEMQNIELDLAKKQVETEGEQLDNLAKEVQLRML